MLEQVDAVIIARDDHETHLEMARPFLEAGLFVFVDKPLSLDPRRAAQSFRPYLETGKLMSCSGMRYARELDESARRSASTGRLLLLRGAVVLSWEKYGIHLIDALFGVMRHAPFRLSLSMGHIARWLSPWTTAHCCRSTHWVRLPRTFRVDFWGSERSVSYDITDNFSMFRRMLWHFAEMIRHERPEVPVHGHLGRDATTDRRQVGQGDEGEGAAQ